MIVDLDEEVNSVSTSPAIMLSKEASEKMNSSSQDLNAVDSADLEDATSVSLLKQIFARISPAQCLAPSTDGPVAACGGILEDEDDSIDFDRILPNLVRDMQNGGGTSAASAKARSDALLRLYRATDRNVPQNRVRLVQAKVSVWEGLEPCLAADANTADRRQALLLLNNLCIPVENKQSIIMGDGLDIVLPSLMGILRERLPECYLASVCLYNLSFLPEAHEVLFDFTPHVTCDRVRSSYRFEPPPPAEEDGDNNRRRPSYSQQRQRQPDTLFAIVEGMCQEYAPFLKHTNKHSVQAESIRWSLGYVRNLCTIGVNARYVAQKTVFPQLVAEYLAKHAPTDMAVWTRDSLPDCALMLLVQLVAFEDCLQPLLRQDVQDALLSLQGKGGIHETRARAILVRLQEEKDNLKGIVVDETKGEF